MTQTYTRNNTHQSIIANPHSKRLTILFILRDNEFGTANRFRFLARERGFRSSPKRSDRLRVPPSHKCNGWQRLYTVGNAAGV